MNTLPCAQCAHFDPQTRGLRNGSRPARYALCTVKSVYLENDPHAPDNGKTVKADASKPHVIDPNGTVSTCTQARPNPIQPLASVRK